MRKGIHLRKGLIGKQAKDEAQCPAMHTNQNRFFFGVTHNNIQSFQLPFFYLVGAFAAFKFLVEVTRPPNGA